MMSQSSAKMLESVVYEESFNLGLKSKETLHGVVEKKLTGLILKESNLSLSHGK